jgi:hypothetical protein
MQMIITCFENKFRTITSKDLMIEATWDEVADMLTTFHQVRRKEDTQMYNLWEFKIKKGTIHRCSADCVAVHGLVLDYDNNLSIEKAIEMYDGFECVIYTTFRNGEEGLSDRFRVVQLLKILRQ